MEINDVKWLDLLHNPDERGSLTAVEGGVTCPFDIKRIFYMHDVPRRIVRGGHAHRYTDQVAIAVHGSLRILVSDGQNEKEVILDNPAYGVFLPAMTWTLLDNFSDGAVCLVISSTHYKRDDSIRTWDEYLTERSLPSCVEPLTADELVRSKIIKGDI